MSNVIRILLLVGAVCTFIYVFKGVKKSRFKAEETFFWIFFCLIFVLLSVFPGIVDWFSRLLQVATPINLVFLTVIFLLLIKVFAMDRKIAKTEHQLTEMTQRIAIDRLKAELEEKNETEG